MNLADALEAFRLNVILLRPGGVAELTTTTCRGQTGTLYGPKLGSHLVQEVELQVTVVRGGIKQITLAIQGQQQFNVVLRLYGWSRLDVDWTTVVVPETYIELYATHFPNARSLRFEPLTPKP